LLSQESIDVNQATTDKGATPLSIACSKHHKEIVNALLNQELIDINILFNNIEYLYLCC
jgi:hypothetical protein